MSRVTAVVSRCLLLGLLACSAAVAQPIEASLPRADSLPAQKTVQVFGQRIAYYDVGQGPTVVLVHGMASQALFDWGHVIAPLARDHRVIALDQIGFGHSDKPAVDYSVQTFVDFLGEFLRTVQVRDRDYTLMGESLGGWVAASYTIQALSAQNAGPYAVPAPSRLLLQDAAGNLPPTSAASDARRITRVQGSLADARGIAVIFDDKTTVGETFVREAWAMKMQANDGFTQRAFWQNVDMARDSVHDRLALITIPTLVVWGGNDRIVPIAQGRDYAARIPGARLVVIPDTGHAPSLERPQAFVEAASGFLAGH
jgi:pimeloyl-ACP methyl ester carboxylesterase